MFEELYAKVISEWPKQVKLKVVPAGKSYVVEGLTSLEDGISHDYIGHPEEVLYRTLHWTVSKAIHKSFATRLVVLASELPPLKDKFEADLRVTLKSPSWEDADRKVVRDYLVRSRTSASVESV
jgi:hypothetical protein